MIHLDTHVVIWLYQQRSKLSVEVRRRVVREPLAVSPIVMLELEVLSEIGRLRTEVDTIFGVVQKEFDMAVSSRTIAELVDQARRLGWTRDIFDRLIMANAMADGAKLVTADGKILANFADAIW